MQGEPRAGRHDRWPLRYECGRRPRSGPSHSHGATIANGPLRENRTGLRAQRILPGDYTAGYPLPDVAGNTNFGTNANKLVTITANTGANRVYVYNANNPTTATAYPKLLDSTSDGSTLTFRRSSPSSGWRPPRPIDRGADAPVNSQAPGHPLRMISRQQ